MSYMKASMKVPSQISPTKRNMRKYFFSDFLSADFWQKLRRVNKPVMKSFPANLLFAVNII